MAEQTDFGPRVGCDPELFVIAKKAKKDEDGPKRNLIVPACGLFGGTKEAPKVVEVDVIKRYTTHIIDHGVRGAFAYQEDNVTLEFNIPAQRSAEAFFTNVAAMMRLLQAEILDPKNMTVARINEYEFKPQMLAHPFAQTIGCEPDYDAYAPRDDNRRKAFSIEQLGTKRFCGGHVHVQYNTNNVPREAFVRLMDLFVALPAHFADRQGSRRQFYGKAGLFRPKPYGIEYRTPSNFWVHPSPKPRPGGQEERLGIGATIIAYNTFALAAKANVDPDYLSDLYSKTPWQDVENAITKEDDKLAEDIVRYVGARAPKLGMYRIDENLQARHFNGQRV